MNDGAPETQMVHRTIVRGRAIKYRAAEDRRDALDWWFADGKTHLVAPEAISEIERQCANELQQRRRFLGTPSWATQQ